jgi:predicted DNA-binding transcriptional regulator AlpA
MDKLTLSLAEAAEALGIHRTTAWKLYRQGEFPVPVLLFGGILKVSRVQLESYVQTGVRIPQPPA